MTYAIKSRWDPSLKRLKWIILRGCLIVAQTDTQNEAEKVSHELSISNDAWLNFQDAIRMGTKYGR